MATYAQDLAAVHSSGFVGLARAAAEELTSRLSPGSRVVEWGCGDGTTARLLVEVGHDVHGFDTSEAMITLARRNAPGATFAVGSFVDAPLPGPVDAVIAVGEVLGYLGGDATSDGLLGPVVERAAATLRPGGLLMFDLAAPGRAAGSVQRGWTEGPGWAVLVESAEQGGELTRRIVTFRDVGGGRFRRGQELHRLRLHDPDAVLELLGDIGLSARILPDGYNGERLPPGMIAYLARRPR